MTRGITLAMHYSLGVVSNMSNLVHVEAGLVSARPCIGQTEGLPLERKGCDVNTD